MTWAVAALMFLISGLYAAVGQAGATGYLAAMALLGLPPSVMRPTALLLNVLVALVATVKFNRAGHFSWRLFGPLAIGSIPMAFLGGRLQLPSHVYGPVVGIVLLIAAFQLWHRGGDRPETRARAASWALAATGAVIGLIAGLTGTGGGVFLGPLLLNANWASSHQTSATTAPFILVNSIAALIGLYGGPEFISETTPIWIVAATTGGYLGAAIGSRHLSSAVAVRLLTVLLGIAGLKLLAS